MVYRPHFPYSTPDGCWDEPFEYYFDVLLIPGTTPAIILGPLDKDAPFLLRGIRITSDAGDTQEIALQLRDADGAVISDDVINVQLYAKGAGFSGQLQGGMAVALDEEVVYPPGATIESTWKVQ